MRVAELAVRGAADRAAEGAGQELHAVADAEHGQAAVEQAGVAPGRAGRRDAHRAAGQDDARPASCARILSFGVLNGTISE